MTTIYLASRFGIDVYTHIQLYTCKYIYTKIHIQYANTHVCRYRDTHKFIYALRYTHRLHISRYQYTHKQTYASSGAHNYIHMHRYAWNEHEYICTNIIHTYIFIQT